MVATGGKAQVVLVALVPPLGPRWLRRLHQLDPLAVEDLMGPHTGLDAGQPPRIDVGASGHLVDGHAGVLAQEAQLLAGVGGL